MSWYKLKYPLSPIQQKYIDVLQKVFNVMDPYGQPIPYVMTDYQKEFHSQSFNIMRENAKHILFIKARGISFTVSSLIELIMTASVFKNQIIPIISQREDSAFDTLNVAKWLITNCNLEEIKNQTVFTETSVDIKFTSTGSVIKIYPSSSAADAIRGRRLLRGLIDEYAFQQRDRQLWAAAENCMQSGLGQFLIGSTPCGRQNQFYEFVEKARVNADNVGMYLFDLPCFDPKVFDPKRPIPEQPWLVPVAPWLDIRRLEEKRKRDIRIFMQEQQADFLDDSISLISYTTIMNTVKEGNINHRETFRRDILFTYETSNPVYIGVDVAETTDYFAVSAFEEIPSDTEGKYLYKQIYLDYFNGVKTPELEVYCNNLVRMYPTLATMWIDETGIGTGLVGYLKRNHGNKIKGVHFSSSVLLGDAKEKASIRTVMLTNFKRMMEDGQVILLPDALQVKHINSVTYGFKIPPNVGDGHGDILFADCLALLKSRYNVNPGATVVTRSFEETPGKSPIDFLKQPIEDRIKFYKKQQRALGNNI